MKKKNGAPIRRKKSAAARVRPFWVLIVLVLIAAGAGGFYAANWPGFNPKVVRVTGNTVVPSATILSRAAISPSKNLWLQNTHAAAARVESIPYIDTARVRRILPASAIVTVTERKPFALVRSESGIALVDKNLRVLADTREPSLPVFVVPAATIATPGAFVKNEAVRRLRDDYTALVSSHVIVALLRYDRFGDLEATADDGLHILFGSEADLRKKIPLVDPILAQVSRKGRPIRAIDLRAPSTPVVVYKK